MNQIRFFICIFSLLFFAQTIDAQSVSIGLNAGNKGAGVDLAIGAGERIGIRGGYNFFKFSYNDREFKIPSTGEKVPASSGTIDLTSVDLLGEFAALPWLRVVAGVNLATSKSLADIDMDASGQTVQLFGHTVTVPAGAGKVNMKIEESTKIHPYIGLALGRLVPNKIIGISGEIGAMQYKTPDVIHLDSAVQGDADRLAVQAKFGEEWKEIYPVISVRVAIRISGLED